MGLKNEIRDRLMRIEAQLEAVASISRMYETQLAVANRRIEDLMNRLMTKNFEELALYKMQEKEESVIQPMLYNPMADEANAGEVLEDGR